MTRVLPQTKFKTIPPKDIVGVAFLALADVSHQILGFCPNSFSPMAPMTLTLRVWESP